jgi:hypothetical protein
MNVCVSRMNLDELPALGEAEISEALQSLVLEGGMTASNLLLTQSAAHATDVVDSLPLDLVEATDALQTDSAERGDLAEQEDSVIQENSAEQEIEIPTSVPPSNLESK